MSRRTPGLSRRQRGVALVIALIMLVILTLLAMSGMNTATTELLMAGNEQYRRNAAQTATAGIEQAISRIADTATSRTAAPTVTPPTLLPGAPTPSPRVGAPALRLLQQGQAVGSAVEAGGTAVAWYRYRRVVPVPQATTCGSRWYRSCARAQHGLAAGCKRCI